MRRHIALAVLLPVLAACDGSTIGGIDPRFADFSKCLRSHGVTHFPDPRPHAGFVGIGKLVRSGRISPQSPVVKSALRPCTPLLPSTAASTAGREPTNTRLANALPSCRPSQLKITMGHSFAGLGTAGANIRFIKHSGGSCKLHGWPTLIAEPAAPGSAHTHAQDRPGMDFADVGKVGVPTVILKPNQLADAIFEAADGSPSGTPCGPAYRTLRVTPPGYTKSVTLSAWIPYLGRFLPSCSRIILSPVLASAAVHKG
jgi:hypothetical protein